MVDTNLLFSIGFSIITNFANVVPLPEQDVPLNAAGLHVYAVGTSHSPTDFRMATGNGANYEIVDGVVQYFQSPLDYFTEQEPAHITKYLGASALTPEAALQLASNALQRLVKTGIALTNGHPKVTQAGDYKGQRIPFFRIEWPRITANMSSVSAVLDVDGRTGRVVLINLLDLVFLDSQKGQQIRAQAYKPDPVRNRIDSPNNLPRPTTNQVEALISSWLTFCEQIGLTPGTATNVSAVAWNDTRLVNFSAVRSNSPVCIVRFTNGVSFLARLDGTVFSHAGMAGARDLFSRGKSSSAESSLPAGWEGLARRLETVLIERLGIPQDKLAKYAPDIRRAGLANGDHWLQLPWRSRIKNSRDEPVVTDGTLGFDAVFDLQTGALRSIAFHNAELIQAMADARSQAK
jgi:hypothetical protein